jgi:hypothetical protein
MKVRINDTMIHHGGDREAIEMRCTGLAPISTFLLSVVFFTSLAHGQGWWWGSPIDPSFDRSAVVELTGTVIHVSIVSVGAPSTLQLQTTAEIFAVILGPGWYLSEIGVDVRNGDTLSIKGAKTKDRRGHVYVVAARVVNHRTNVTFELRDTDGRPKWKSGTQSGGTKG